MKKTITHLALLSVSALLLSLTFYHFTHAEATCTGANNCKACKNCKYCKHCAKEGGTCGICKK
jgi:hypothetical protein